MDRCAVLLATHTGARFLEEQLQSLAAQRVGALDIFVSDDGSTDGTRDLLEAWRERWRLGSFRLTDGPRRGFSENFRSLANLAETDAEFVAFCDQDDVWDPDKLAVAMDVLRRWAPDRPALYCSRTRLVDEAGKAIGFSPLFSRPPSFRNALVQSIAGGNTMVFNRPGFALFRESARRGPFVSHDWWAYIIITGAGGLVHYDPVPHVGYRQHAGNLVGRNSGFRARLNRLRRLLDGQFIRWTTANLESLDASADLLTAEARATVAQLRQIRARPSAAALRTLREAGLYRQTSMGNLGLVAAVLLHRF
jgi:glycosyltransferase involved in cell wall biosynthesis